MIYSRVAPIPITPELPKTGNSRMRTLLEVPSLDFFRCLMPKYYIFATYITQKRVNNAHITCVVNL